MDKGLEKNITIADVAEALGVTKTTVSRAISLVKVVLAGRQESACSPT